MRLLAQVLHGLRDFQPREIPLPREAVSAVTDEEAVHARIALHTLATCGQVARCEHQLGGCAGLEAMELSVAEHRRLDLNKERALWHGHLLWMNEGGLTGF